MHSLNDNTFVLVSAAELSRDREQEKRTNWFDTTAVSIQSITLFVADLQILLLHSFQFLGLM